jgi:hypothetical protein
MMNGGSMVNLPEESDKRMRGKGLSKGKTSNQSATVKVFEGRRNAALPALTLAVTPATLVRKPMHSSRFARYAVQGRDVLNSA